MDFGGKWFLEDIRFKDGSLNEFEKVLKVQF
jgi:hypothetical protein